MKKLVLLLLSSALFTGCASPEKIAKKVAFESGLDPKQVKVSNVNVGVHETTFNANINGKKHNCTAIGGNFMTFGNILNPNCIPVGGNKSQVKGSCNAMLRAAGKCN